MIININRKWTDRDFTSYRNTYADGDSTRGLYRAPGNDWMTVLAFGVIVGTVAAIIVTVLTA